MKRARNVLVNLAASTAMALSLGGCPDEEEQPVSGGTGGDSICHACLTQNSVPPARCVCTGEVAANESPACWTDEQDCVDHCEAQVDGNGQPLALQEFIVTPCSSASAVGSCSSWRPDRAVGLVSGTYEIDETFAENLAFDSSAPLWSCDDAKLISVPGGFEVANASSGELVYEVGLRNGDQVQDINGQNVTTWEGAEKVFSSFLAGTSSFKVTVTRGRSTVYLKWTLVP